MFRTDYIIRRKRINYQIGFQQTSKSFKLVFFGILGSTKCFLYIRIQKGVQKQIMIKYITCEIDKYVDWTF